MRIIGPENLIFGVDDMEACRTCLADFGLEEREIEGGSRFEAADGTALSILPRDHGSLPPPLSSGSTLRLTIWGCEDQDTVDAVATELERDRPVARQADGSIRAQDDLGFEMMFRVTTRSALDHLPEHVNSPGGAGGRGVNNVGADQHSAIQPRTLSHVVYFVPDSGRMERFYGDRLGFRVTDRFNNVGPFMRPQANDDHHCLFFLQTPPFMQGLEHVAFHMRGPTELMLAGSRMVTKGYESFWGPGRHNFGSNWFWYFNSPMGTHLEFDADMDKHDDSWEPRTADAGPETSQMFLFENVARWSPGGPPPGKAPPVAPAVALASEG